MDETVYRQRLIKSGVIGAGVFIACTLISSIMAKKAFDAAVDGRFYTDPSPLAFSAFFFWACAFIGLVMVLVGREHYPYRAAPEAEKPAVGNEAPKGPSLTELHFGKPVGDDR